MHLHLYTSHMFTVHSWVQAYVKYLRTVGTGFNSMTDISSSRETSSKRSESKEESRGHLPGCCRIHRLQACSTDKRSCTSATVHVLMQFEISSLHLHECQGQLIRTLPIARSSIYNPPCGRIESANTGSMSKPLALFALVLSLAFCGTVCKS